MSGPRSSAAEYDDVGCQAAAQSCSATKGAATVLSAGSLLGAATQAEDRGGHHHGRHKPRGRGGMGGCDAAAAVMSVEGGLRRCGRERGEASRRWMLLT